jgi:hypothetical protein
MMLRKKAINIGLKSHSFSKLSTNFIHDSKNKLNNKSLHCFSSDAKDPTQSKDDSIDSIWDTMSEVEKRQFAIMERFPEKHPKKTDQIYFYRGLSNEIQGMPGAAIISFSKAIDNTSNDKLKSESYEKIACIYEKMNLRDKAEDIRKKKSSLIITPITEVKDLKNIKEGQVPSSTFGL